jgi:hypothetical protein
MMSPRPRGEDTLKVIIAGDRNEEELALVYDAVAHAGLDITEVVSGGARGVDTLGEV